ncbi:MFS transporter [Corynebacterium sp. HMSC05E07]|uniref:MFS transporter n=1 Tax=Corynebacterium sp. HMSC05E07 TaxID=1581117 RepID=UPI001FF02538|nr:MFS transporter [Corynebacterium sp. HMSC05E07]
MGPGTEVGSVGQRFRRTLAPALLFTVVCLTAVNLRSGIASVAPVLGQIQGFFGISSGAAGLLTALPGLCFAVMGLAAVPIARHVGLSRTLAAGTVALVAGLALRPWVSSFSLFVVLTVCVVAGIALANVLLPAWIKQHGSGRTLVALMTTYTTMLGVSSALGPLSAVTQNTWQGALWVWCLPAIAQLIAWMVVLPRTGRDVAHGAVDGEGAPRPMYTSPTAVAMLFFFGLQSTMAYVQMGWLPRMLVEKGVGENTASVALAIIGVFNILGGIVMPWLISRLDRLAPVPVVLALCTCAGWAGVLLAADSAPLAWATLMGIGGMCFPLVLALLTARTRTALTTARLSGFVQPGGYVLAGLVPLLVGVVRGATGNWTVVLVGLMALSLCMLFAGLRATTRVYIDDELVG